MSLVGKLLPSEGYFVTFNQNPPIGYERALTHLYQPLIGMKAVMMYQTLLHETELQEKNTLQTHHTLMNYLRLPLDEIYEARVQLEGIGLLRTLKNEKEGTTFYIYKLQSPFSPSDFFKDAMLSELLYHHIGKDKFNSLKRYYHLEDEMIPGEEITKSFCEVFQTFQPLFEGLEQTELTSPKKQSHRVELFDFNWMETILRQRMIPTRRVLTRENQELISEMMFLYDLATHEVEKSVLWALTEENYLDVEEFKRSCHDQFRAKQNVTPIELTRRVEAQPKPAPTPEPSDRPLTKEEQLVELLETISPKHLLEDLSKGRQASEQDMRIIQEVMTSQKLPAPVMNVLIHYVLLQSGMKLSKPYLEKIASHWSRVGLQTAKDAMAFAKEEAKAYKTGFQRHTTQEVIPEWFENRKVNQVAGHEKQNERDVKSEQQELEALMRQYAGE